MVKFFLFIRWGKGEVFILINPHLFIMKVKISCYMTFVIPPYLI